MALVLLCQALLTGFVGTSASSEPPHAAVLIEAGPQCLPQDVAPVSEVLSQDLEPVEPAPATTTDSSPPALTYEQPQEAPVAPTAQVLPSSTPATLPAELPTAVPTSPPPTPTSPPQRRVAVTPTSTPAPLATPTATPSDDCEQIIVLVNEARQEHGLAPLKYNPLLADAALDYAGFLASHNVLNHTADGRTLDRRAEAAGYTRWVALGENLAGGYTSFDAAVTAWMASPAHRDNILNPGYVETGVGCVWVSGGSYGSFFVQEFGTSS